MCYDSVEEYITAVLKQMAEEENKDAKKILMDFLIEDDEFMDWIGEEASNRGIELL